MKKQLAVLTIALALAALPALGQSAAKSSGTATTNAAASTTPASKSGAAADKIDINSASKQELMKLDGIGDAISAKIIAGRPYKTKRDLLTQKIVNQSTYAKISDKIIAHAAAPAKSTAAAKPDTAASKAK
jgi:DNA uptake protein ComE-like DNA-binding protein